MFHAFYLAKTNPSLSKYTQATDRTYDMRSTNVTKNPQNSAAQRFLTEDSVEALPKKRTRSFRRSKMNKLSFKHSVIIDHIKSSFQAEISKVTEECRIKQLSPYKHVREMLTWYKDTIEFIILRMNEMKAAKSKREQSVEFMEEINSQIVRLRNPELKIMIFLKLSKLSRCYKMVHLSIRMAKMAKRLADCEPLLRFKQKAYFLLGLNYLDLRLPQAKIYITKFIMVSWKLNHKDQELKGYDVLGKYFYYEGNIDRAKLMHQRMVDGEMLPEKSNLRRLGIAKLEQGSIGKGRKDLNFLTDENFLNVSSDDEPFEIIFNHDDEANKQAKEDLLKAKQVSLRKTLLKFNLRTLPNLGRDLQRLNPLDKTSANNNIRINRNAQLSKSNGALDLGKLKFSRAVVQIGDVKDPIMINHLSPNRCLVNYQYIELNKTPSSYLSVQNIDPLFDQRDILNMSKLFVKLTSNLQTLLIWLDVQIKKYDLIISSN